MLRVAAKDHADHGEKLDRTEPEHETFARQLEAEKSKKKEPKAPEHEAKRARPEDPTVSRTQTQEPTRRIPKITDVDDIALKSIPTTTPATTPANPATALPQQPNTA